MAPALLPATRVVVLWQCCPDVHVHQYCLFHLLEPEPVQLAIKHFVFLVPVLWVTLPVSMVISKDSWSIVCL